MEKLRYNIILLTTLLLFVLVPVVSAVSPRVIKTVPENGDNNVDPGLKQIRIEFDQDMSHSGYSICGGGPKFPKTIGKPKWINKRTIVMKVTLKPAHKYEMSVNSPSYQNFKNTNGESAEIYPISFKTSSATKKSNVSSKSPAILLQEALYAEETEGDLDKAIEIYEQVINEAGEIQRLAAKATYQLGICFLKKGDKEKAAEYFQQVVSNFPSQNVLVKKADVQLKKIKPEIKESVFEQIDYQVIRFLGEQFGKTALEAGQQHLSVNSHIYYVDRDGYRYQGGMNAFHNWTGKTITSKVRFGGTSYPNQTHYGVDGHELKTEIVPDKTRPNHWQIYWIPDEPLAPEESLYYGWSMNNKRKISKLPGDVYSLTMQNKYGGAVVETFFLVLPKELKISQSSPPTGSQELLNFDVYWWTTTVQQGENHVEQVQLIKVDETYIRSLIKNLYEHETPRFKSLNELIKIGEPAVEPLIEELNKKSSANWQVPKTLSAIGDPRSIEPLMAKWKVADFAPMNDVIAEGLSKITDKDFGKDIKKWEQWWSGVKEFYTPADTIKNFMAAAIKLDADKAMTFVAPDSHDYEDIKEIFKNPDHPFNIVFRKIAGPIEIIETNIVDSMCSAIWRITFKEDCDFGKDPFKAGETFNLDGNLHKYGDKWLITGI